MKFMDFFYSALGTIYGWHGPMRGSADTLGMVEGWYINETTGMPSYADVDNGSFTSSYLYCIGAIAPCSGARFNNRSELGVDPMLYSRDQLMQRMAGAEMMPMTLNFDLILDAPTYTVYMLDTLHYAEVDYNPSFAYFDTETSDRITDLKTVITDYVKAETAKFITGARSLDEYDAYLSELNTLGVDEYLEYYLNDYNG